MICLLLLLPACMPSYDVAHSMANASPPHWLCMYHAFKPAADFIEG
jgi:hypothetical protein